MSTNEGQTDREAIGEILRQRMHNVVLDNELTPWWLMGADAILAAGFRRPDPKTIDGGTITVEDYWRERRRADANEKERDALRDDADVMEVQRARARSIMWHELAQKAEAEAGRIRESWIAARHVVFAARTVLDAFGADDEPHIDDHQSAAIADLRETTTAYDQRNHEPAPGGSGGEAG